MRRRAALLEYVTWRFKTMNGRVFLTMLIFGPFAIWVVLSGWGSESNLRNAIQLALGLVVTGTWFVGPYLWHSRPWRSTVEVSEVAPWRRSR